MSPSRYRGAFGSPDEVQAPTDGRIRNERRASAGRVDRYGENETRGWYDSLGRSLEAAIQHAGTAMHCLTDFKNFARAELNLFEPLTVLLGRN